MSDSPRFFTQRSNISDIITLCGSDAHHARDVLRLRRGDLITVCDMQKTEYICCVECDSEPFTVRVIKTHEAFGENSYRTVLFQALTKGEKFDMVVQKATELGVTEIVPVLTERCVSRPDAKSMSSKLERFRKIALSAAKQSGRGIIPDITECVSYREALNLMKNSGFPFICYEGDGTVFISELLSGNGAHESYAFLIGPEGGLSAGEIEMAK
ncbi:MAG TPA: RsmE family RNA methyltransferase, partial [Bacillota bacterium]|nr:RsmE family RNA methyltransferase [Bacillota bacterium]